MNYTKGECTCHISYYPKPDHIVYCPKHAAAPDMYEALRRVYCAYTESSTLFSNMPSMLPPEIKYALAKAEGKC